jgi:hypothetical protein
VAVCESTSTRSDRRRLPTALASGLISIVACLIVQRFAVAQPAKEGPRPDARSVIKNARQKRDLGLLDEALQEFDRVTKDPQASADDRGEAALEAAGIIPETVLKIELGSPADARVIHYYDLGDQAKDPRLRAIAKLNRGTYYLNRRGPGDLDLAWGAFDEARASAAAIEDLRFLLEFNAGRLFTLQSQLATSESPGTTIGTRIHSGETAQSLTDKAYNCFVESLEREPTFEPSSIEAFNILFKDARRVDAIDLAIKLALSLFEHGQPDLAMRRVVECLKIWGDDPQGYRFTTVLVRYYHIAQLTPDELGDPVLRVRWRFEPAQRERVSALARGENCVDPAVLDRPTTQRQFLEALGQSYPRLKSDVSDIEIVLDGDFRSGLDKPPDRFADWASAMGRGASEPRRESQIRRESFSAFLKQVGDYYASQKSDADRERALKRYEAAWVIDRANTSAALATVALLGDRPDKNEFNRETYHQILNLLFPGTRGDYGFPLQSERDRSNLERIHRILNQLNAIERYPLLGEKVYNRRFHLDMALAARQAGAGNGSSSDLLSSAEVMRELARVNDSQKGPPEESWNSYLRAAEIYIAKRRVVDAADTLREAERLPIRRSEKQNAQLYKAWARVEDLGELLQIDSVRRNTAPRTPHIKRGLRSASGG